MKKVILFIALLVFSFGFSNNNTNEIKIPENLGIISKNVNLNEFNTPNFKHEIVSFKYDDDFAPCTLVVTVKIKIIVEGQVTGQAEVTGSLTFQDCKDIGAVGAGFIRGLIDEAISQATRK